MGYNGNNRGRTHNWSGIRNKKDYNWGLNLTAKALVAPFYILGALIDLADDIEVPAQKYTAASVKPSVKPPSPIHAIMGALIDYYPEISQRISRLSKQKDDLLSLKRKLQSARHNIFLLRKRKRIINVLEYKISRKEQWIESFEILEKKLIGRPVSRKRILGKVAVHYSDQAINKDFQEGVVLTKKNAGFCNGINITQSLAYNGDGWQIVFYSKGLLLEDKKQVLFVPYKDIDVNEKWIIHYADCDTHGYDVESSSWMYTRRDGWPDLRYSCNSPIYYVHRYQVELKFKRLEESTSVFFVFKWKDDSEKLCKLISSKYDPEKTEKVKLNGYRVF